MLECTKVMLCSDVNYWISIGFVRARGKVKIEE